LPATRGGQFEQGARDRPVSASYALLLLQAFDRSGRLDDPISLVENGSPKLRSGPLVRLWLALSYALAGRKERAATDFATFRVLAPKWTLSTTRRNWFRCFTPQFADRIVALSREYSISEN
jgi:hypothetical protein